eukprot:INCI13414.6.p1 GENE.INCI13414.6~~INCI13414.6.p1  ORF type:complete len:912 (-),score=120.58 INCI13414.6:2319-5054(-)
MAQPILDQSIFAKSATTIDSFFLFARQLAQGMIYLHERGIVHRDLKPENVLLSVGARPHVRICDFGVSEASMRRAQAQARLRLQKQKSGSTHRPLLPVGSAACAKLASPKPDCAGIMCNVCGCSAAECSCVCDSDSEVHADFQDVLPPLQALGTIEYMAPEVFACYAMDADCRGRMNMPIDVYAFGIMLWELMRAPLEGAGASGGGGAIREDLLNSKRSTSAPRLLANLDGESDGPRAVIGHTAKAVTLGTVQRSDNQGRAIAGSIDCATDGLKMRQVLELGPAFDDSDSDQRVPRLDALRQATWPRFVREVDDPTGPPTAPMDSETVEAMWSRPSLAVLRSDCPAEVVEFIEECLSFEPEDRPTFRDANALLTSLDRWKKIGPPTMRNKSWRSWQTGSNQGDQSTNGAGSFSSTTSGTSLELANNMFTRNARETSKSVAHKIGADEMDHLFNPLLHRSFVSSRDNGASLNSVHVHVEKSPAQKSMSTHDVTTATRGNNVNIDDASISTKIVQPAPWQSHRFHAPSQSSRGTQVSMPGAYLSCWGSLWHRFGLHFRDHLVERQFMLQRLRSDEYYKPTKWALFGLGIMYLMYGLVIMTSIIVQPYKGLNFAGLLPNIGVPLLKSVLFFGCAAAGWVQRWRLPVNALATPLIVIISILAFIVVPVLNYDRRLIWANSNFSIPADDSLGLAFAPLDSAFRCGILVGPNNTLGDETPEGQQVCAGSMRALESFPEVPVTNHVVTACQSFNFQLGMGSLYFAHTWGFVLMNGMTFPVIMLFFGLPLRLYLVCLLVPMAGTLCAIGLVLTDDLDYQDVLANMLDENSLLYFEAVKGTTLQSVQRTVAYLMLYLGIYSSCIVAAIAHERYHRSLFTVHTAMRQKRDMLLESEDFHRYRYIMKRNREWFTERAMLRDD